MHQPKDHGRCHLCILGDLLCRGLDTRYHPCIHGLESEDEFKNETLRCIDPQRWRHVGCIYIHMHGLISLD